MADNHEPKNLQEKMERNIFAMFLATAFMVSIAGIVEIVPLFYLKDAVDYTEYKDEWGNLKNDKFPELVWERTFEMKDGKLVADKRLYYKDENGNWKSDWKPGDGVRPYTPLELAGRDIYQREGCMYCHSQMIRPFRDERERYGHYSLATESIYDHPFQWGSKRTGSDLAREGGKYSDEWHVLHLMRPQDVVPESTMPAYPWLAEQCITDQYVGRMIVGKRDMKARLEVMRKLRVPYTDEEIALADEYLRTYNNPNPDKKCTTEMDAIVAYMQVLGTMVKLDDSKVYRE